VELVCYRAAAYRTPIRARGHGWESSGRYHDPGGPATQYFSLHPLGSWAEAIRNQRCGTVEAALEARLPVWAIRVVLDEAPLLVDFDAAAAGGLPHPIAPEALVAEDPTACRALAKAHRADPAAPKLLRVPSAALPGTENLVILGARRGIEYLARPHRSTQIPHACAAAGGHSPRGLFPHVRLRGRPHAGLAAWKRGEELKLPEISTGEW